MPPRCSARKCSPALPPSDDPKAGIGATAPQSRSCTSWYPRTRPLWAVEPLGAAHRPGLVLAETLEAARQGDLAPVRSLRWPEVGIVRAHLPLRWAVELAAAGIAGRNPPPYDLVSAVGARGRPALHAISSAKTAGPVAVAAKNLAREFPAAPEYRVRIGVIGPLQLWHDGEELNHPDLRRRRARELLCYMVARRRARRVAVGEELWPEVADPAHNLRVTLNYLQQVLQPDRPDGERPYFLRATRDWLELAVDDQLEVDAWELDASLDQAEAADRAGAIAEALTAYRGALPLWRGEPYEDAPYAPWAEPSGTRLRSRYVIAAVRAGELFLAASAPNDARDAADHAIIADPTSEPVFRLLARSHLANDDLSSPRAALERCRAALAELDAAPDATTAALFVRCHPTADRRRVTPVGPRPTAPRDPPDNSQPATATREDEA